MARKGWAGSPPTDDDDARKRILDATVRCIERSGPTETSLSDVALDLGITRRTVYRYFTSTDDLFAAVSGLAVDGWTERMRAQIPDTDDAVDLVVEYTAYIVERLPEEPLLGLLLTSGRTERFSRNLLRPEAIARCRHVLLDTRIDWSVLGFDDTALDELVELLLRLIQSMVVAPPAEPRSPAQLRAYLRRWVGPALRP